MRTPGDAARAILAEIQPLPPECIPLPEALDRVLTQDTRSPLDLPPWDNAAMDGYAVRSADVPPGASGIELRIVESIPAGGFPTRPLAQGECSRIFTGAPLPTGADGVIRQEDTTPLGPDRVRIGNARDTGRNVRYRGEDIEKGAVVLPAGSPLGPAQLGVLASIAMGEVYVHRKPRVAFLGSGDEIADLDEVPAIRAGRKIASSNTYTLLGNIRRAGGTPMNLGIARDDPTDIRARLQRAFGADIVISTAGISVGEHDHMRRVLENMQGTLGFWRIAMRPGAPVGFGRLGGMPWIGLPGNPVSTMVTFELFVRPAIRRLLGYRRLFRRTVPVTAGEAFTLKAKLTHFQRAVVTDEDGTLVARLTGPQGSGILTSMAKANALLIVPADLDDVTEGTALEAILLDDPVHVAEPPWE
ncbi:MAG: molybdopterin molybdotransferase MoeA [Gemmatimonadota bacterium]|nr:molybdopterin molybdotransferase MoeA [Gemmatimonadota bacterium]